jgi:hypothetical protein
MSPVYAQPAKAAATAIAALNATGRLNGIMSSLRLMRNDSGREPDYLQFSVREIFVIVRYG